jgi:hypothetical protein
MAPPHSAPESHLVRAGNRCAWRATPLSSRRSRSAAAFRCTMRINCGELDPGAVIRPIRGEWHPRMPSRAVRRLVTTVWTAARYYVPGRSGTTSAACPVPLNAAAMRAETRSAAATRAASGRRM